MAASEHLTLNPGEVVCRVGDRLDAVYQVHSGRLGVMVDGPDGELRIGALGPEAFIGEITALTGGAATATVTAEEPTVLGVISLDDYTTWLGQHPDEAEQVAAIARKRSNRTRTAALVAELTGIGDGEAIDQVIDLMTWQALVADEVLFEQGDQADAAYIVVNGRVRIIIEDSDTGGETDGATDGGTEIELGRGALVGELGIIEDAPRSATVKAVRDTTLARISREQFETLAVRHPATVVRIIRTILHRARGASAPPGRCRSVAVVSTGTESSRPDLIGRFVTEIERFGGVVHFSAETIESVLGKSGAAMATTGSLAQQRLSELIHEAESNTDYLLFELDTGNHADPWTRRALRYADRLLIMTSADPDRAERERIEALVALADSIPGILIWIVKEYGTDAKPFGAAEWLADRRVNDVIHIRTKLDRDVQRLARLSTGNGFGVVFGGGGARGFAHIGVIQACHELGVPVDAVCGASIGAVLAGGQAIDIPPAEQPGVAQRLFNNLLDYTVPVVALIRSAKVNANMVEAFGDWLIEDSWIPMTCVSTNLTTSQVELHRSGSMSTAIRASVSLPGVLPPVTIDGQTLVDGGVLDNLPVDAIADDDRIGTVIALDAATGDDYYGMTDFDPTVSGFKALWSLINPRREKYPSAISTVVRSTLVAASGRREAALASGKIDLYLSYDLPGIGLLDFDKVPSTTVAGYRLAKPRIEEWIRTQPWWSQDR